MDFVDTEALVTGFTITVTFQVTELVLSGLCRDYSVLTEDKQQ